MLTGPRHMLTLSVHLYTLGFNGNSLAHPRYAPSHGTTARIDNQNNPLAVAIPPTEGIAGNQTYATSVTSTTVISMPLISQEKQ